MINVTLVGDKALVARFDGMHDRLRSAILRKTTVLALKLEALVKKKLTNDVLNVRSGALRRSIQHSVESTGTGVTGKVFSSGDVKYAAIQEFGGQTPPHVIEAKGAALAFMQGGKMAFYKRINHPGSKIPERSYLRSSLVDMTDEITEGYREAAAEALTP